MHPLPSFRNYHLMVNLILYILTNSVYLTGVLKSKSLITWLVYLYIF